MFSLFQKKPTPLSLEQQIKTLVDFGITLNPEATVDDLLGHYSREDYEVRPYKELIPVLGLEMERDSFEPLCSRLWMCDFERVEDHGSYVDVIERLNQMSERCLPVSAVTDFVDIEAGKAWVEFNLADSRMHWDAKVDNDWLDPHVLVRFDNLLKEHRTPFRIYSNHTDFGQCAFLACMTPSEFAGFQKLAKFNLREIEKQV